MNAIDLIELPRAARTPRGEARVGTLNLFAVFHLNLGFSSIEEDERDDVIARCYWPLLALAETRGPIGIEAPGYTLEEIERRDPAWIVRLRALVQEGRVELVGSGYAQAIGPLLPAAMVARNLELGNRVYERVAGVRPTLALVNEQAYSAGLVGHYLDAGYRAMLMDWDNPASEHPDWPAESRYLPQRAVGNDDRAIALLWTNTVAFQKLQRYAHGDMELGDYLAYVVGRRGTRDRAFCLYASDAEIFDYRPGRYRTEEKLVEAGEWRRIAQALRAFGESPALRLVAPSAALKLADRPYADRLVALETASCPVPVKKQRKYNLSRWAVTGRDDTAVNAACERIYRALQRGGVEPAKEADWKELCRLWSSDFRTHITAARWKAFRSDLKRMERLLGTCEPPLPVFAGEPVGQRYLDIETASLRARLDRKRGLAIAAMSFAPGAEPAIGGLPHGYFDDIALQADWYTGDCVLETPGEPKLTDLDWAATRLARDAVTGDVIVVGIVETPRGPIEKNLRFHAARARVDFDLVFHWARWGKGSLRLGHVTLLPEAFDWNTLALTTHNGGKNPETFALADRAVDHGAPVSHLVSASGGFGMTEGWAELGDGVTTVRIDVDRAVAPLLGLLGHRRTGGSLFCQLVLSALEMDDTRKPSAYRSGPRRFRFSISGALR